MENILVKDVLEWTKSTLLSGSLNTIISNFSTDSRTICKDDFFIPIVGENYDGNDFIIDAVKNGARGFAISKNYKNTNYILNYIKDSYPDVLIIQSLDTLDFLKSIARGYIRQFKNLITIGITGSVGKTTTKNFLVNILKNFSNVVYSEKNFNNEIGIPKTIFNINKNTKFFVAELGMRAKNQIKELADICNVKFGIITGIGPSHLEFFNNIEEIAIAKAEINEKIFDNDGVLFLNADDKYFEIILKNIKCKFAKVGKEKVFEYNFSNYFCDENAYYSYDFNKYNEKIFNIKLNIPGFNNIYNSSLAISLALYLNIDIDIIKKAIQETKPEDLRMEIIEKKEVVVINDCYNANPLSMQSAIDTLSTIAKKRKMRSVAILGDMYELGSESQKFHKEIFDYLISNKINVIIVFGKNWLDVLKEDDLSKIKTNKYFFKNKEDLLKELHKIIKKDDVVLIKGSRANKMENIIDYI